MNKKLFRYPAHGLTGLCYGLGEYFGIDPTIVRLIMVLLALCSCGHVMLFYIIAAFIVPLAPDDEI